MSFDPAPFWMFVAVAGGAAVAALVFLALVGRSRQGGSTAWILVSVVVVGVCAAALRAPERFGTGRWHGTLSVDRRPSREAAEALVRETGRQVRQALAPLVGPDADAPAGSADAPGKLDIHTFVALTLDEVRKFTERRQSEAFTRASAAVRARLSDAAERGRRVEGVRIPRAPVVARVAPVPAFSPEPPSTLLRRPWGVFQALVVALFLYVGYVFLDASTRGQFTWKLRILSAMAFATIVILILQRA